MAIWQFHIYFIPRQTLLERYGLVPAELEMKKDDWIDYIENGSLDLEPEFEDALTIPWWENLHLSINDLLPLLQSFGDIQQWTATSNGVRKFGNDETNDISVCFDSETGTVLELSCRLDLREVDKDFIDKTLALATRFDCLLMDTHGGLYEPTIKNLLDKIQTSNASRFVEDPRQFLEDLSKGIVKPE